MVSAAWELSTPDGEALHGDERSQRYLLTGELPQDACSGSEANNRLSPRCPLYDYALAHFRHGTVFESMDTRGDRGEMMLHPCVRWVFPYICREHCYTIILKDGRRLSRKEIQMSCDNAGGSCRKRDVENTK